MDKERSTILPGLYPHPRGNLHTMIGLFRVQNPDLFVSITDNTEGYLIELPEKSPDTCGESALQFKLSFCPILLLSQPYRCHCWEHSPKNLVHTYLCLPVCLLRSPTWDRMWSQEAPIGKWRNETGKRRKPIKGTLISRLLLCATEQNPTKWEFLETVGPAFMLSYPRIEEAGVFIHQFLSIIG